MLRRYPDLAWVLRENVAVDIPQEDLPAWATLVQRIQKGGQIASLPLTNRNIDVTEPDYGEIHQMVREAIDPNLKPTTTPAETPSSSTSSSSTTTPTDEPTEPTDELTDITESC